MAGKDKDKAVWIYGVHSVKAVFERRPAEVSRLMIAEGQASHRKDVVSLAEKAGVKVKRAPPQELDDVCRSGSHQGIAVRASLPESAFLEDVLDAGPAVLVALDGITDPQNLGAIIRSAEALGASAVVLPRDRSASITPAVHKVSEGAVEWLPICRVTNLSRALEAGKQKGYWVFAADPSGETSLENAQWSDKSVVVIGSEGRGIRAGVLKKADFRIFIKLAGKTASLNAAQAAAIFIHSAMSAIK